MKGAVDKTRASAVNAAEATAEAASKAKKAAMDKAKAAVKAARNAKNFARRGLSNMQIYMGREVYKLEDAQKKCETTLGASNRLDTAPYTQSFLAGPSFEDLLEQEQEFDLSKKSQIRVEMCPKSRHGL